MAATANVPTNWSDPSTCPFCGEALPDPGAGFVDHLADSPDCDAGFTTWKDNVADDVAGGWSG